MKVLISLVLLLGIVFSGCDETDEINPTALAEVFCQNSSKTSVEIDLFNHGKQQLSVKIDTNSILKIDSGKFDNFGSTLKIPYLVDSAIFTFENGRKLTQIQTDTRIFSDSINCILNSFDYEKTYENNIEKWLFTLTQADYERAE